MNYSFFKNNSKTAWEWNRENMKFLRLFCKINCIINTKCIYFLTNLQVYHFNSVDNVATI